MCSSRWRSDPVRQRGENISLLKHWSTQQWQEEENISLIKHWSTQQWLEGRTSLFSNTDPPSSGRRGEHLYSQTLIHPAVAGGGEHLSSQTLIHPAATSSSGSTVTCHPAKDSLTSSPALQSNNCTNSTRLHLSVFPSSVFHTSTWGECKCIWIISEQLSNRLDYQCHPDIFI